MRRAGNQGKISLLRKAGPSLSKSGGAHIVRWFKVPGPDDSCTSRGSTFSVRLQARLRGCFKIEKSNFGRASASSRL